MKWEALYTGTSAPRTASDWAVLDAALTLAESIQAWLDDATIAAETADALRAEMDHLAEVIDIANATEFESDCRRYGRIQ